MKVLKKILSLKTSQENWILVYLTAIFFALRIPSLVEPYWYGDEGIYQVIGMAIRSGRLLYQEVWDNKPPILYILYAAFNGDLFYLRFLSLIFGLLSLLVFFNLSKVLLKGGQARIVSAIFFTLLFALPLLEGNIANAENFMILPIITALYLVIRGGEKITHAKHIWVFILAGFLLSIAFLIKIVAIFDFLTLLIVVVVLKNFEEFSFKKFLKSISIKKISSQYRQETTLILSFLLPIVLVSLFFVSMGSLKDFYRAVFSQNVGYVGWGNRLLFPLGGLTFKTIFLFGILFLIINYRRKLGIPGFVIYVWLALSCFNALFAQRPYTHYLLVLLPSFSLFVGFIVDNKKLLQLNLITLFILLVIIISNFRFYIKIFPYYVNYISFLLGGKKVEVYQSFFDKNTPRDYEIVRFIQTKTSGGEGIFLWSDSGQIYALSGILPPGRYIVSYHITNYPNAIEETKKEIWFKRPKFIIDTKHTRGLDNFTEGYKLKYKISNADIYERQF